MNSKILFSLVLCFLIPVLNSNAQEIQLPFSEETNLITYNDEIEKPGELKNDLYHKAFSWANSFYKNPKNVIRQKDVLNSEIICKGRFRIVTPATKKQIESPAGIVQYTLTIQFKDYKYKYTITDINWKQTSYYPIERWMDKEKASYLSVYEKYLEQTDANITNVISSLKAEMAKAVPKSSDDW